MATTILTLRYRPKSLLDTAADELTQPATSGWSQARLVRGDRFPFYCQKDLRRPTARYAIFAAGASRLCISRSGESEIGYEQ